MSDRQSRWYLRGKTAWKEEERKEGEEGKERKIKEWREVMRVSKRNEGEGRGREGKRGEMCVCACVCALFHFDVLHHPTKPFHEVLYHGLNKRGLGGPGLGVKFRLVISHAPPLLSQSNGVFRLKHLVEAIPCPVSALVELLLEGCHLRLRCIPLSLSLPLSLPLSLSLFPSSRGGGRGHERGGEEQQRALRSVEVGY